MECIEQMIKRLCPEGVKYVKLGEIGTFTRGNGLQKKDFTEEGFPCIHYGQIHTHYSTFAFKTISFTSPDYAKKLKKAQKGDLIIATTSEDVAGCCKAVAWLGESDVAISGDAYIYHHGQDPKYISYIFQTDYFHKLKEKYASGVKVIRVSGDNLANISIPLPPLEIQSRIVEILDKMTSLTAELEAELEARKQQYEYYRNKLLDFTPRKNENVKWMTLGEIGEVCMCKRIMKHQTSDTGEIPFYKIGTFGGVPNAYISRELYEDYKSRFSFPKKGDILISAAGTIGRTVIYDGNDAYYQDSNIVWIDNDESIILNKYLFYLYGIIEWKTEGSTIKRLYNENLKSTQVAIPPLEEQERIVAILDRFEALTTDLQEGLPAEIEARRQQYEYYRNKLLTFEAA